MAGNDACEWHNTPTVLLHGIHMCATMCGKTCMYIANCNSMLLSNELKATSLFGYTLTYSFCVARVASLRLILFAQRQFKVTVNCDIEPGHHTFPSSQVQLPSFQVRNQSNKNALTFCTCSTACMHLYTPVHSSTVSTLVIFVSIRYLS